MRTPWVLAVAALSAALLSACHARRVTDEEKGRCTGCHGGTDNDTGAPPLDAKGQAASPAVGAHTAHLEAGVRCDACHVVPSDPNSPGHIDGEVTVVFSTAAGAHGTYDRAAQRCSGTWCHAVPDAGGLRPTPTWNDPAYVQGVGCGACHQSPPPDHVAAGATDCVKCHPQTVSAGPSPARNSLQPGGPHANGVIDYDPSAFCTGCHGDPSRATTVAINKIAPPVDADGQTNTPEVGAHLAHVMGKDISDGVECTDCHGGTARTLPSGLDFTHATLPTEVTLKKPGTNTVAGTYATGTRTCSSTYCHDPRGAGTNSPTWTETGTQSSCGRCHSPQAWTSAVGPFSSVHGDHDCHKCHGSNIPRGLDACGVCHAGYQQAAGAVNKAAHANGTFDVNATWGAGANDTIGWNPGDRSCSATCHAISAHGVSNPKTWP